MSEYGIADYMSAIGGGKERKFADPFYLPSGLFAPKDWIGALQMCAFIYNRCPEFAEAWRRVYMHFRTEVEFRGDNSTDKRQKKFITELLRDKLNFFRHLEELGEDLGCYGNAFSFVHYPFDRWLIDTRRGKYQFWSLDMFREEDVKYNHTDMTYKVPDPTELHLPTDERAKVDFAFKDIPSYDANRINLVRVDPKYMVIDHCKMSGTSKYIMRFIPDQKRDIEQGKLHSVNNTSYEMLKALSEDNDYIFNTDTVFHLYASSISGLSEGGWGVPPIIKNYSNLYMIQCLRRVNECISMDFMTPWRVFSPEPSTNPSGTTDMILNPYLGNFVNKMIENRRKDPFAIHMSPIPIHYEEYGAQGKTLVDYEGYKAHVDNMLDSMGIPAELFRCSLEVEAAPMALRIFENSFSYVGDGFNSLLKFHISNVLDYLGISQTDVQLKKPSMADSMDTRSILLQLAQGGEVPRSIVYSFLGIDDPVAAAKARATEDIEIQSDKDKIQKEYMQRMALGTPDSVAGYESQMAGSSDPNSSAGGGSSGAPAGSSMTPLDMMSKAKDKAQELLQIDRDGDRAKALRQIEATDPNFYAVVKQQMEDIRSQGASAGRQQAGKQQQ